MKLRKALRYLVIAAIFAAFVVVGFLAWHRQHMLGIVREWGRLEHFPASARSVEVTTSGSMFTRAFRASFVAPSADVEKWLQESPGAREATVTNPSPNTRVYSIRAGGGAMFAEVKIDSSTGKVDIYVYWS